MPELWPAGPGSQFDAFLFAKIGEDGNGQPLSVVSALARMDLDPWDVAHELANLPVDAATQKLAGLFRVLPDQSLGSSDRSTVAARLIALLQRPPARLPRTSLPRTTLPWVRMLNRTRIPPRTYLLVFAICFFLLLWLTRPNR
jgi:hypothetical protein